MVDSSLETPRRGCAVEALLLMVRAEPTATWEFIPADPDGPHLQLLVRNGHLEDIARVSGDSLLSRALLGCLRERERRRLEKRAADAQEDPGLRAFHDGWVPQEEAVEMVQAAIDADLADLLGAGQGHWQNLDGAAVTRGLCGALQLQVPLEDSFLFAARRHRQWEAARSLPIMRDVLSATPQALPLLSDPELPLELRSLLEAIDGKSDIADLVELSEDGPWHGFDRVVALLEEGIIDVLRPMELFQLGAELERDGEPLKALRRFTRSSEQGLDDFDIDLHIATLHQELGHVTEAIHLFRAFADKCTAQFRIPETLAAYQKILELDPEDTDTLDRWVDLLGRHGKGEDALRFGMLLAPLLLSRGDAAGADSLLENLASRGELDEELMRLHLEIRRELGDENGSSEAASRLGSLLQSRGEFTSALEVVEERIATGEQTPSLRARQIELCLQIGETQRAVAALEELTPMPGWSAADPCEEAWALLSPLATGDDLPDELLEWLATGAETRDESALAADLLLELQTRASQGEELEAALRYARRRQPFVEGDSEALVTLARLERSVGNSRIAASILADALPNLEGGSSEEEQIVEELLATDPLHLDGHLLLTRREGADLAQVMRCSLLQLLSGDLQGATNTVRNGKSPASISSLLSSIAAILSTESDRLFEAAETAAEEGNRGLLALFLELLEEEQDPRLTSLRQRYEGDRAREEAARRKDGGVQLVSSPIQAITERLRGLKTQSPDHGLSPTAGNPSAAEKPVSAVNSSPKSSQGEPGAHLSATGGVNDALQRLRDMRSGNSSQEALSRQSQTVEEAPPSDDRRGENPVEVSEPSASASIAAAAARLGAMRTSPQD